MFDDSIFKKREMIACFSWTFGKNWQYWACISFYHILFLTKSILSGQVGPAVPKHTHGLKQNCQILEFWSYLQYLGSNAWVLWLRWCWLAAVPVTWCLCFWLITVLTTPCVLHLTHFSHQSCLPDPCRHLRLWGRLAHSSLILHPWGV